MTELDRAALDNWLGGACREARAEEGQPPRRCSTCTEQHRLCQACRELRVRMGWSLLMRLLGHGQGGFDHLRNHVIEHVLTGPMKQDSKEVWWVRSTLFPHVTDPGVVTEGSEEEARRSVGDIPERKFGAPNFPPAAELAELLLELMDDPRFWGNYASVKVRHPLTNLCKVAGNALVSKLRSMGYTRPADKNDEDDGSEAPEEQIKPANITIRWKLFGLLEELQERSWAAKHGKRDRPSQLFGDHHDDTARHAQAIDQGVERLYKEALDKVAQVPALQRLPPKGRAAFILWSAFPHHAWPHTPEAVMDQVELRSVLSTAHDDCWREHADDWPEVAERLTAGWPAVEPRAVAGSPRGGLEGLSEHLRPSASTRAADTGRPDLPNLPDIALLIRHVDAGLHAQALVEEADASSEVAAAALEARKLLTKRCNAMSRAAQRVAKPAYEALVALAQARLGLVGVAP